MITVLGNSSVSGYAVRFLFRCLKLKTVYLNRRARIVTIYGLISDTLAICEARVLYIPEDVYC